MALGKERAGLFTNSDELADKLIKCGSQVDEPLWRMPVDEYHHDLVKPKFADLTNSPGKPDGASSQAAAFLNRFVEPGV